jgi:hypothetical protein
MNWKQVRYSQFEREQIAIMLLEHLQKHPPLPALRYHFIGSRTKNKSVAYLVLYVYLGPFL